MHVRQRSLAGRELGGVEYLNARVLPAVERRQYRHGGSRLAAQPERDLGVVEPQAKVVLVRRAESRRPAG